MIIKTKVITNAKKNSISKYGEEYKIYITAQPVNGKANKEIIKLLADYFNVKKKEVVILKGEKSKYKIIRIIGKGGNYV